MRRNRKPQRGAVPLQPAEPKVSVVERVASVPWNDIGQQFRLVWRHVAALFGLFVLLWLVVSTPRIFAHYQVKEVRVEGVMDPRRVDMVHEHMKQVLRGENFFSLPLETLHESLQNFGWVEHVDVRRRWPGVVELGFVEIKPVAVWNGERLISEEGTRFVGVDKYDIEQLPKLSGPNGQYDEVLQMYHRMNAILAAADLRITSIAVDARFTAKLTLNKSIDVVVDRHHNDSKLERFVGLYQRTLANNEKPIKRVDLRYADGMAVTSGDATEKRGS